MDVHFAQQLLDELASSIESLETQHGALLLFLKDKGIVTDEQLAPYLNQASNASNVRWRTARLRLERVLAASEQEQQTREQEKRGQTEAQKPLQQKDEKAEEAKKDAKESSMNENAQSKGEQPRQSEMQAAPPESETTGPIPDEAERDKDAA